MSLWADLIRMKGIVVGDVLGFCLEELGGGVMLAMV